MSEVERSLAEKIEQQAVLIQTLQVEHAAVNETAQEFYGNLVRSRAKCKLLEHQVQILMNQVKQGEAANQAKITGLEADLKAAMERKSRKRK